MAGDANTSINVIQLAIEVGSIVFFAGGLWFMVRSNSKDIETLKTEMKDVRENRVTPDMLGEMEDRLNKRMEAQADVITGKILIALGADRRVNPR